MPDRVSRLKKERKLFKKNLDLEKCLLDLEKENRKLLAKKQELEYKLLEEIEARKEWFDDYVKLRAESRSKGETRK